MRILILLSFLSVSMVGTSFAQWGKLVDSLKSNPLVAQQAPFQKVMSQVQEISTGIAKMPMNKGKMELLQASLPILVQVKGLSADVMSLVKQGKPVDIAKENKITGLLDQLKGMMAQPASTEPLTAAQLDQTKKISQQVGDIFAGVLKDQTETLKAIVKTTASP